MFQTAPSTLPTPVHSSFELDPTRKIECSWPMSLGFSRLHTPRVRPYHNNWARERRYWSSHLLWVLQCFLSF